MIATLSNETEQILGITALVVITERVDDVALLIAQMIRMGLPKVLDKYIPKGRSQRYLSWGWTATIWLAYLLTEGDHRKVSVEHYISGMRKTLSRLTGQKIEALDFSDDRLAHLLKHLSKSKIWNAVEKDLDKDSIEIYQLPTAVVRCDMTTVSGFHAVQDGGLMQFGNRATNLSWDTEQKNDSPSTKKSVIPAGRAKRGLAGIQLPWMAITKHTID